MAKEKKRSVFTGRFCAFLEFRKGVIPMYSLDETQYLSLKQKKGKYYGKKSSIGIAVRCLTANVIG